ncbi:hypothetical protein EPD60_11295 [Flaviaesturariibacter flavus]|uniref:Beta-carotene 15,15'-monooxygenase n=1 Tax=Flaviaesturariibacter flavus TaxID=2502780 RepID=A0A4R1BC04_9BACT|nr:DUF6427 family protein [Flaviaesturariibacter flavus]TCJ14561.1 hypothetical protein EPD60_11295 [Flaviaesturariibacter flavus]
MIALFKQKAPGTIAILFIAGLLLKLPLFTQTALLTAPTDGPMFRPLADWIGRGYAAAPGALAFVLLFAGALILNSAVNQYRMTSRQTFLPALSYLLITSLVPEWSFLSAPLCAALLLELAFVLTLRLYGAQNASGRIFNIGLLTGLAGFFYPPALLFGGIALLGLMVLRPLRVNELFLLLLGVLTPTYFYAIVLFLYDRLQWKMLVPQLHFEVIERPASYTVLGAIVLLVMPFLLGSYYVQASLRKMLIQARKNWSLVLFWLLLAVGIPFLGNSGQYTPWLLVAAPLAAFHACAFLYPSRNWVSLLLFFVILMYILALQYGIAMVRK